MHKALYLFAGLALAVAAMAQTNPDNTISLPTSKTLTLPAAGSPQRTNGFPTAVALSPDGKYLAILNNGYGIAEAKYRQSIALLNLATNQLRDFPDARLGPQAKQTYFLGLAWSSDGRELYASMASLTDPEGKMAGDTGNGIAVYRFENGAISPDRFLKLPLVQLTKGQRFAYGAKFVPKGMAIPYPAGIAAVKGAKGDELLVAENLADDVVLLNAADGKVLQRFDLSRGRLVPSEFPYTVVASRYRDRAYCSLWNGSVVAELDLHAGKVARTIAVLPPQHEAEASSHPMALLLTPDETVLFAALSNRDAVAVISTESGRAERYLDTKLPGQTNGGTYPNALALSGNGSKLFVANASSDAVAVFPIDSGSTASYFIPTEWYPTALAVHGDELLIATGKSQGTGPNAVPADKGNPPGKGPHQYIASMIRGSIARVNLAEAERDREKLTREVLRSSLMDGRAGEISFQRGSNPIRHVIYVIKENRTYDQIFGDIAEANGDPSLVMYGEAITPNQHKLARQFGVLDNFYDSGEVSGDGHVWSTSAITSDYTEKTWEIAYRGRERMYDFEGWVGDYIPMNAGVPDVNEPATGYLWGNLARHNLSYRHYGEFVTTTWCTDTAETNPPSGGAPPAQPPSCPRKEIKPGKDLPVEFGGGKSSYQYAIPLIAKDTPTKPELKGHYDPNYADFKLEFPDQFRADEFLREFAGFVKARESGSGEPLPQFVLLRLPDDHTAGTHPGMPAPNASVADNDLAVGRVVEAVSSSPYWDDTAIFILEDDAQNGADHVDAHRSTALVISKYSPGAAQGPYVDHHFYTTVNLIHTMEVLLGLPPMNANDAYAPVMAPLFAGTGDQPAFKADYRNRDNGMIYQANAANAPGARESSKLDFSHADAADAEKLNAILWHAAKGNTPMPAPRHTVF
ncbi:MAG TPA: beta-propeller fold lactonase family protein, partial [Bryobacteraceae bacterium]|nr:beta-propeller fold lactonase family protein [Bryobacteraceae bacterium]